MQSLASRIPFFLQLDSVLVQKYSRLQLGPEQFSFMKQESLKGTERWYQLYWIVMCYFIRLSVKIYQLIILLAGYYLVSQQHYSFLCPHFFTIAPVLFVFPLRVVFALSLSFATFLALVLALFIFVLLFSPVLSFP